MAEGKRRALVLSGGGAHAAYQAGVLKALAELLPKKERRIPFHIYTGESAGAINGCFIATGTGDFPGAAEKLWSYWANIRMEDIFHVGTGALLSNASRWLKDISLGGLMKSNAGSVYLLDTAPLREFIGKEFDFGRIKESIASGEMHGIAVSATNYATGNAVSFFDGAQGIKEWVRSHRLGRRAGLGLDHIMASSAIPILFPPVRLERSFYGDGSVRMRAPLSPAIHLGAEKIFAIGSHYFPSLEQVLHTHHTHRLREISLTDILGVLMNAGFLDNLDGDLELMKRINMLLASVNPKERAELAKTFRKIDVYAVRPSAHLAGLAAKQFHRFNFVLRYLLGGLGVTHTRGLDLISYLAFDGAYTKKLLHLGYNDVRRQKENIREFFEN